MRRNCNLELQLHQNPRPSSDETQKQDQQSQQQLTIFYNGMMCVRDVTEVQARTILFLANREMEERAKSALTPLTPMSPLTPFTPMSTLTPFTPMSGRSEPSSPNVVSPLAGAPGMSMKRSLQRFLQKRKHRVQATYPYHHDH